MTTDEDSLSIEKLMEVESALKRVWDSGVLTPREKQHMWEVQMRISGKLKELGKQDSE
jgi:hypothetical protein